jgi:hypothetical protein
MQFLTGSGGISHEIVHMSGGAGVVKIRACSNLSTIVRGLYSDGIASFYRGVFPVIATRGAAFAGQRVVMDTLDRRMEHQFSSDLQGRVSRTMVTSCVGSFAMTFLETPIYVLKNRAQVAGKVDESLRRYMRDARRVMRSRGIAGLYVGWTPHTILCTGSWPILYGTYEVMIDQNISAGVAGLLSAVICWPWFYPFDVIRTRMQVADKRAGLSFKRACREHFRQPFRKWFPALTPTLVRAMPRFYITMLVIDVLNNKWC